MSELPLALAEVVPVGPRSQELVRSERSVPAAVIPAVAAGSFAAGAAVVGLVRRRRSRALSAAGWRPRLRRADGRGERLQIVGTRSLLLDVHLLGRTGK